MSDGSALINVSFFVMSWDERLLNASRPFFEYFGGEHGSIFVI